MNNDYNFDPVTGQSIQQPQQPIQQPQQQVQQQPFNYQQQPVQPQVNVTTMQQPKKTNKRIIMALILIIFAIVAGIGSFVFFKFFKNGASVVNLNSIFDPKKPIIIKNNGKYGYITSEGKTMIEPKYNKADNFAGDYAVVNVDNTGTEFYSKTIYQLIDKKGDVKLSTDDYSKPQYYSDYDVWLVGCVLYDSNLKKISPEGATVDYIKYGYFQYVDINKNESGIMTYKGKKVFAIQATSLYTSISANEYNSDDLYACVSVYGTADIKKKLIVSLKTGDILFTLEDDGYYIANDDNGIFYYYNMSLADGFKDRKFLFFINGKLAYQPTDKVDGLTIYDYQKQILEIDYGYNYAELGKSERWYYYDVKNKKMLDAKPNSSTTLEDLQLGLLEKQYGFKEYSSSDKYGLMSGDKVVVPAEYDDIKYLEVSLFNYMKSKGRSLFLLEKDDSLILYDLKSSKAITTFNHSFVTSYDDSTFIKVGIHAENNYTTTGYKIYNLLSNKSMDFNLGDTVSIGSNYVTVEKNDKTVYYNTDFKQIYSTAN